MTYPRVRAALSAVGLDAATLSEQSGAILATWGLDLGSPTHDVPLLLSMTNWSDRGSMDPRSMARWLADGTSGRFASMLPPFAALGVTAGGLRLVSDHAGFRQLYLVDGAGWAAVSTSARVLGVLSEAGLDRDSLMLQSQLGWLVGDRTILAGVTKLGPSEGVLIKNGVLKREPPADDPPIQPVSLDQGVRRAAGVLRDVLARYLDENPDPTLQLTGGQDSRIVLSSIPPARRRGLKVMTLDVHGSADTAIAAKLANRFGMLHTVRTLDGMAALSAEEAFELVCSAARRLDGMSDPIARAATLWAERSFDQGARLSGLGGEYARGFYYTGRVRPTPVTLARTDQLAKWRMLANEAVERSVLAAPLAEEAITRSIALIHQALAATGLEWYEATDELYYRHRMQRWGGLGETAVCFDRSIVNPMLDYRFVAVARGLRPIDKAHSLFLARLQLELDEELASMPLDNRPAPRAYISNSPSNYLRQQSALLRKVAHKSLQRAKGDRRPPPGASVLVSRVSQHLRESPEHLEPVRRAEVFD
ncbi:MAG TPA: hypothetical protein PLB21_00670, partial [Actinomycetota bacterium]|nr:hypothetical protein [Actinomycetota bacterium]